MAMDEIKNKIKGLEDEMQKADFWGDKIRAQEVIKELGELKEKLTGGEKYDKGGAVLTLFAELAETTPKIGREFSLKCMRSLPANMAGR